MEIYSNTDKSVMKYIHLDGSETSIKTTPSKTYYYNELKNKIDENEKERWKYSVIVSSSVGCPISCKFCYLTTKRCEYLPLSESEIIKNIKEAVKSKYSQDNDIIKRYVKLCFMGMGDPFFDLDKTSKIIYEIVDWCISNNYAIGLDSIDIGTTFPRIPSINEIIKLHRLQKSFKVGFNLNSNNDDRSIIRFFYSLHSVNQETRKYLIPVKIDVNNIFIFKDILKKYNFDLIFHHIFLDGINDTNKEINDLIKVFNNNLYGYQLRVLGFNECDGTELKESKKFKNIIKRLSDNIPYIKYQVSPGSEIKSACGQFIIKNYKNE